MKWLLIFIICGIVVTSNRCDIKGYFWRDLDGVIPDEAVLFGIDNKENATYIGQAFYPDYMIPGNIYKGDASVFVIYNKKVVQAKENVKILCSLYPNSLIWLQTNNNDLGDIAMELVRGGFEKDVNFYIGRQTLKGQILVGYIPFSKNSKDRMLNYAIGTKIKTDRNFDVLVYDKKKN